MATATFYPSLNGEVYVHSEVPHGRSLSWLDLISATGTGTTSNISVQITSTSNFHHHGEWIHLYRSILLFDTSSLGIGSIINSAVLQLYETGSSDTLGIDPNVNVYSSNPTSNTALAATDFRNLGNTAFCYTPIAYSVLTPEGYNSFTFNGAGIAAINPTGITKLGIRNANYDVAQNAPVWTLNKTSVIAFYSSSAEEAKKPRLVVTYTIPPTSIFISKGKPTSVISIRDIQYLAYTTNKLFVAADIAGSTKIYTFVDPNYSLVSVQPAKKPNKLLAFGGFIHTGTYGTVAGDAVVYKYMYDWVTHRNVWAKVGVVNFPDKVVYSMLESGGKIYVGLYNSGKVFYYDSDWVSAGRLGTETGIISLATIGSTIYGSGILGKVYKYVAGTTWTAISTGNYFGQDLAVLNNELYGIASSSTSTKVYKYVSGTTWTQVGATLDIPYNLPPKIAYYRGKLYATIQIEAGMSKVYRYDDPDWIWVQVFSAGVTALKVGNGILWAGLDDGNVWSFALPPEIALSVSSLSPVGSYPDNADSQTFEVWNFGTGTITYAISDDVDWLDCVPDSGTSTGEHDTITVNYDTAGKAVGVYTATITITDVEASNSPQEILVTLTISPKVSTIALSVTSLSQGIEEGEAAPSETFEIWNSGDETLTYAISDDVDWLDCVPDSGTSTGEHDTITVNYDTAGKAVGVYTATITITAVGCTNSPQEIPVSLVISPPPEEFMRGLKWFDDEVFKGYYLGR